MHCLPWELRSLLILEIFVEFSRQISLRQIAEIKPKFDGRRKGENCKNGQHHFKISRYVLLLTKGSRHNDEIFVDFVDSKPLPDRTLFSSFIRSKKLDCTAKIKKIQSKKLFLSSLPPLRSLLESELVMVGRHQS